MVEINDFTQEKSCVYKGENYLVRDNGAVKRLQKEGKPKRKLDDIWTFGKPNEKGYLFIASVQVHRIVATAFYGDAPTSQHIVDHIDTNRQNNRPENLRWVTKLENALNNPITRKRIELCCGSIEAFIGNPSIIREKCATYPEIKWMHTVTPEEAAIAYNHLLEWAKNSNYVPKGGKLGEWIYQNNGISEYDISELRKKIDISAEKTILPEISDKGKTVNLESQKIWEEIYDKTHEEFLKHGFDMEDNDFEPILYKSITSNAAQENWKIPAEFPLCPKNNDTQIIDYYNNIECGKVFSSNKYGESVVIDFAISDDKTRLFVETEKKEVPNGYALTEVYLLEGLFVHKSIRTFFDKDSLDKYFTLAQGKEWTGGEVLSDFC